MSVINQMLRELDARKTHAGSVSAPAAPRPEKARPRALVVIAAGALVLGAGAAGAYLLLQGRAAAPSPPVVRAQPPVAAVSAQPQAQPAVAVAPSEPSIPAPPPSAAPVQAAPRPAADAPRAVAPGMQPQAKPAPMLGMSISIAALPPPAESSVVKKPVDLSPEAEAQQYYADATALQRAGKIDAAIAKLQLALERNPTLRSARLQLARLMQGNGQVDAALAVLKAGYPHAPDGVLAVAAGRMLADEGRRDEALSWLQRGGASLRAADHALLGALYAQGQRHRDAANAYEQALAAEPQQGGWWLGLGLSLEALGRADAALNAYRNALQHGSFKGDVVRFLQQKTGSL